MEDISVIAAVHHPLRRRIFDFLLLHGATQAGTLARELDAQVGSISHHLRMLEKAGGAERADDPTGAPAGGGSGTSSTSAPALSTGPGCG